MSRHRSLAALVAVAAAAWGGAEQAHAAPAPLPLGTDGHGVRIVQRGHPARLVVLLSAKRHRALAGHQLVIVCTPVPQVALGGGTTTGRRDFREVPLPPGSTHVRLHVPPKRGPLATGLSPRGDWCALTLRKRDGDQGVTSQRFAIVPLTDAGAAFVDERAVAVRVIVSVLLLEPGFPHQPSVQRIARTMHAIVLSSPAQTPPPGQLGIYSDGHAHAYAAQTDRAGDLLFYEQDDDVLRTNLLRYLQDESLL
jgi:hypothetical protein